MNAVLCEAVHFPTILVPVSIGFVLGVLTDRLYDKAKEKFMSSTRTSPRSRWSAVYDRLAPFLVVLCLVASTYASISTYHQQGVNDAQQVQRDKDQKARTAANSALIACFDRFATDLSGSLPPVRKATAERDEALLDALIGDAHHLGLGFLLVRAQDGVKSDPKKDLADLVKTFNALKAASDRLVTVRKANPYPPPPSKFCDLR